MLETLSEKTAQVGRTVAVAAVAVLATLGLVWYVAMIGHLYCLRCKLDECCVDD